MKKRKKARRPSAPDVRNAKEYFALPLRDRLRRDNAFHVLSLMRKDGLTLSAAAREVGVAPRSVKPVIEKALVKQRGRYKAVKGDRFLRVLVIPDVDGKREVSVRGSRNARLISDYDRAIDRFLMTGDESLLEPFRGLTLSSGREKVTLLTDPKVLERLGSAGALSFESIYAGVA